ncbi:MAG: DUF1161 domain-containing protein [Candidatus Electrothrix sp. YB6]
MSVMKSFVVGLLMVLLGSGQVYAAIKSCEELKAEIAEKINAAGVKSYILDIVYTWEVEQGIVTQGKIVGSCEGGKKKIIYIKLTKMVR